VTVLVDDFAYSVDICDPVEKAGDVPTVLSAQVIRDRLKSVADDAKRRLDKGEKPVRVGILTGDERDTWTKVSQ
jgi:carnitine O-acetyltransferase